MKKKNKIPSSVFSLNHIKRSLDKDSFIDLPLVLKKGVFNNG